MTLRMPTRCDHCRTGVLVPSTALDLPPVCLACGRPAEAPPAPLPLVRVEPEAARPDRTAPLKDQLIGLLRGGSMRRSELYTAISDGHGATTSYELSAALAALRQEGLVDVVVAGQRRQVWRLVDGEEAEVSE